ncbi:WGxxGxxG family protein [Fictibacillus nanhaiensis]|jgi:MYXO-CTERM domain-containing protein|uniref:WGxxGxxG family protein n=1 Tax=Fictibacillus nanhaiensis TaxID=742169 RepID=UPI0030B83951
MKRTKLTMISAIILSLGLLFGCNVGNNAENNNDNLAGDNTVRDAADNDDNFTDTNNVPRNVAATNDQEDNDMDLGWIGLIGLAGLLGLRRRDEK